ncbi:prephenate dehydrogenase [Gephyromycinifex aptenodytis]|uniref:prephenate dehydrogenase n=1 Tax=Gephyromycinifex aptenodytis TaxID=2716227 RepID=UPI0014457109|nr:prephenate dehydrogenase [Gephyromycinifex aptenodytis]
MSGLRRLRIVGTGLIGTSLGLALRGSDVDVSLADPSPTACTLARDLGAGRLAEQVEPDVDLVLVACPPDVVAQVVAAELTAHPNAVVSDVASVKSAILKELRASGADLSRYIGSHPMAGRERSGAVAGRADLFSGRPWVLVPHESTSARARELVTELVRAVGAVAATMPAREHDAAVAAVSHVPQVAASLVASQLRDLPTEAIGLSGQGVRDVTRIAASDPTLWTQILVGNAAAVAQILRHLREDLDTVLEALSALGEDPDSDAPGARSVLARLIAEGNAGQARIPGKHGAPPTTYATVTVLVPDEPGQLGRLFTDMGQEGINLEDLHIDHAMGRLMGVVELLVRPADADPLRAGLSARGWTLSE